MNQQEVFGVAVVGAGNMGQNHMKCIREVPWLNIRAVADTDAARARTQAETFDAPVWAQDYREVVARPDVDVVFVCTPTAFHADVAVESAAHGKEIFCEKPLALSWTDGKRMVDAARRAGVRLGVNFCYRFQKANQLLRARFRDGKLGRPVYHTVYTAVEVRAKLAMHDERLNGGPILDILCHFVDTWRFLFDSEPCRVFARAATFARGKDHVESVRALALDTAVVTVEFQSGDVGTFHVCWGLPQNTPPFWSTTAVAPQGLIEVQSFKRVVIRCGNADPEILDGLETDVYAEQVKHYATALKEGGLPRTTGEDGLIALKVSLAALESAHTGEAISLSP